MFLSFVTVRIVEAFSAAIRASRLTVHESDRPRVLRYVRCMRRGDDVSSRILIALRDYAAMKAGAETAYPTFEAAVLEADCTVTRATDPRAWVALEVLESVAAAFNDTIGPAFVVDAVTWVIPWRRELSAMSLSAVTTPDLFYAHLDCARELLRPPRLLRDAPRGSGPLRRRPPLR